MKLARLGTRGAERPAVMDAAGIWRDIGDLVPDLDGAALSPEKLDWLRGLDHSALPAIPAARFGTCVARAGKIVCVGLNYVDHAAESGFSAPEEPILFMKATTACAGANDPIEMPPGAAKLDYEVELGVVIGRRAKRVPAEEAMAHVAGFCIVNDVSERSYQLERGGQWMKGKSLDGFGPCGPWLVTADEIGDVTRLRLQTRVNGEVRQDALAADMIFDVPTLVSYISGFMTLEPGDIIASGTPPGVALGMIPPKYLKIGDVVELEIEKLGRQRQEIV